MCVVQLEHNLLRKSVDIVVGAHVLRNRTLNARGNEEVLLLQAELLAGVVIVVRVKHFADQSCEVLLLNGLMIITAVKALKVKVIDRFGIPDAKRVYNVVAVADNREVIRDCANGLCALLRKMLSSLLVSRVPYITAELYFAGVLGTLDLKRVAVCKPVIRTLYLITVADFLLKHSVLIADTATVCGISECSKRQREPCQWCLC